MKKIKEVGKMIGLFFRLVYEMIKNYPHLNQNIDNNFMICKKICRKIIDSADIGLHLFGRENFPEDENFLLVSNHRCFFDVVFLLASVEKTIRFVAAKELWRYPLLRKYLSSIGCVALDRYTKEKEQLKQSILSMKEALQRGNLVLFPEGECSYHDTSMRRFKRGGFLGIPSQEQKIVPVYIKMQNLKNLGRWMIPQGDVCFFVDPCFSPATMPGEKKTASEIARYTKMRIEKMQKENE